jgi:hypothetical protein
MHLLSAIFTFAVQRKLRHDNPCKGIVRPKTVHKTRRLSVAEYAQLGTALSSASGPSVPNDIFLFLAVSRAAQLWANVSFDAAFIRFFGTGLFPVQLVRIHVREIVIEKL